jgi:hypothetical protein
VTVNGVATKALADRLLRFRMGDDIHLFNDELREWEDYYNHVSCCPTNLCVGKLKDTLIRVACGRVMPAILDAPDQLGCG